MADNLTKEKRSKIMRSIKGKDTRPEKAVRSMLHAMGYRFRLHREDLPGSNKAYWREKIEGNVRRDKRNIRDVKKRGYRIARIWECETLDPDKLPNRLSRIFDIEQ